MGSSWCNTVSKLVMKLDAIKLGRALATYISDATPCSSSVRSRQGTTVFVSEGTDGHVPPRGPPDQTSPSNPRKLSPALLSRHDAPAGITETTLASLASSGLIRMRSSPAKWSSDWLEKQNVESHTATDGEQVREQKGQISTKLRKPTVYIGSTGLEWNPGYCRVPFLSSTTTGTPRCIPAFPSCSSWAVQPNLTIRSPHHPGESTDGDNSTASLFLNQPRMLYGSSYPASEVGRMEREAQAKKKTRTAHAPRGNARAGS